MPHAKVIVQWRKGLLGDGGTFVFPVNPFLERPVPGNRTATLTVPLLDGVIIQQLGLGERTIELRGVLFNKTKTWDAMEAQRNALINGLSFGCGQLHIISPNKHIKYDAIIDTNGIQFDAQQFVNIQDYRVNIRIPSPVEDIVTTTIVTTTKTVNSDAEIT